ncbi:MAG: tail protein X [Sphingomonas sp.]|jgi:phage tail protein X|uniref:tail protein X n=1 Tax=Sphingomonas sp. TaxID=28214 RepID=UPI0035683A3A
MANTRSDTLYAQQGDTLDALVWRERGFGGEDLAGLLATNPGLAELGAILPLGTAITIPESTAPAPRTLPLIQLWD